MPDASSSLLMIIFTSFSFSSISTFPLNQTWQIYHLYVLAVYVDDCVLFGSLHGHFIVKFKADFGKRFKIEDLGAVFGLLGCEITRDRTNMILRDRHLGIYGGLKPESLFVPVFCNVYPWADRMRYILIFGICGSEQLREFVIPC